MSLISCRDASFAYDGAPAVRKLNFAVENGDYLCVVGENGAGKSTLVKGLLGLIKPASGSVEYGDGLRLDEVGYLPQQHAPRTDFPASVEEVVLSGCLNSLGRRPFYQKAHRDKMAHNLELMSATNLRKRKFSELSGGQQQRVLLARALCATSRLVLLDEPASGLDPEATVELYDRIDAVNDADGIAVIMVSHDTQCAATRASHILHLSLDQLFFGTRQEYLATELGRSFLGVRAEESGDR